MSSKNATAPSPAYVRKSTMVLVAILAFAIGLFAGLLVFSIRGAGTPQPPRGAAPEATAPNVSALNSPELAALRKTVQTDKTNVDGWNRLGHWYYDHEFPQEAIDAYENSLVLRPDDPDVMTDLGIMYRAVHQHEKALELFQAASRVNPKHVQSRFNAGIVLYFDLQRQADGLRAWEDLAAIAPDYTTGNGMNIKEWIERVKAEQ